ncbi:hypothetical protein SAMN05216378_0411 [Paenibacillus catalpae]|uniref:Uncharacterized protein n=1 Tax=Paenibacillus catalpae TaxID=1045775 RepID=A0A1I1T8S0_9BACL|nr:hypothetical protein SAMN05216378_0411 [Paenibacillus catalpae]
MLYIFGELPGTSKSTLSAALARELRATYPSSNRICFAAYGWSSHRCASGNSGLHVDSWCVPPVMKSNRMRLSGTPAAINVWRTCTTCS